MNAKSKRLLMLALGWGFIVLGFLGLFLPILQGILFLAIGLILLAKVSPLARLWRRKLRRRYPQGAIKLDQAEHRATEFARRCLERWQARH